MILLLFMREKREKRKYRRKQLVERICNQVKEGVTNNTSKIVEYTEIMTTEGTDKPNKPKPSFFKRLGGKKSNHKSSSDSTVTESTHVGDAPEERKMPKLASYHIGIQKVTSDYLKVKAEKGGCGC